MRELHCRQDQERCGLVHRGEVEQCEHLLEQLLDPERRQLLNQDQLNELKLH